MKHQTLEHEGKTYHFQKTHEWHNLKVIKVNLPDGINGTVALFGKDKYRIFINDKLPEDEQLKAFIHEMVHLYRGDLDKIGQDVNTIEEETHRETDRIMEGLAL